MNIEIPDMLIKLLLTQAAEQELSVEEIVERAMKNYIGRKDENAI